MKLSRVRAILPIGLALLGQAVMFWAVGTFDNPATGQGEIIPNLGSKYRVGEFLLLGAFLTAQRKVPRVLLGASVVAAFLGLFLAPAFNSLSGGLVTSFALSILACIVLVVDAKDLLLGRTDGAGGNGGA